MSSSPKLSRRGSGMRWMLGARDVELQKSNTKFEDLEREFEELWRSNLSVEASKKEMVDDVCVEAEREITVRHTKEGWKAKTDLDSNVEALSSLRSEFFRLRVAKE
ncbi:hypothetical protein V6N13_142038 [Hibiscus sabdariffa]|uniref:Uncharacterized protein n=1 Tax=Hibiscus sabdariffa TaxID=183260 RepID=A0ABR2FCX5_9ROSI